MRRAQRVTMQGAFDCSTSMRAGVNPTMGAYAQIIPNFLRAALMGCPLPVEGDGAQIRSFIWIDDIVEGLVRLLSFDGVLPPAVNLGCDEPIAITGLAALVERFPEEKIPASHSRRAPIMSYTSSKTPSYTTTWVLACATSFAPSIVMGPDAAIRSYATGRACTIGGTKGGDLTIFGGQRVAFADEVGS